MPKIDCVAFLRKKFPDAPKEVVQQFVDDSQNVRSGSTSLDEFLQISGKKLEDFSKGMLYYRKSQLDNLIKTRDNMNFINSKNFAKDPYAAMQAIFHGSKGVYQGSLGSVSRISETLKNKWSGIIERGIVDKGYWKALESGALDEKIRREMFELRDGGSPGITGSDTALEIAKVLKSVHNDIADEANRGGAFVKVRDDYAGKQTHEAEKIRRANEVLNTPKDPALNDTENAIKTWRSFIEPLIDPAKTYEGVGNKDSFWKEAWNDIVYGKGPKKIVGNNSDFVSSGGTFDVGQFMSRARKIHFKDGESFAKYAATFGKGSVLEDMTSSIERNAKQIGLMQRLGTDPEAAMQGLLTRLRTQYKEMGVNPETRAQGDALAEKLQNAQHKIEKMYNKYSGVGRGSTGAIEDGVVNAASWLRTVTYLAHTGASLFSQFDDPANAIGLISSSTGKNVFETMADVTNNYINSFKPEFRKEWAARTGVALDYILADMVGPYDVKDLGAGIQGKLLKGWFFMNGMKGHEARMKSAVNIVLADYLGEMSGKSWAELPGSLRNRLGAYDFGENHWNEARAVARDVEGRKYLLPADMKGGDAQLRLLNMFNDISELSTTMPQAREKYFMYSDDPADTFSGAVKRLFFALKGPLLTIPKIATQVATVEPGKYQNIATWGTMALVAAAAQNQVKSYLAGKTVDYKDPTTAMNIFLASGFGGVVTDLLTAEQQRSIRGQPGAATAEAIVGAPVMDAAKLVGLTTAELSGKGKKEGFTSPQGINTLHSITPGQNLWWYRKTLGNMLWDSLQNHMNPGYMEKQNLKRLRAQKQAGF